MQTIEENNRMGKTRGFFKKIGDIKGIFHARMGMIKNRNRKDLKEAEEINKKWQEYTEELEGVTSLTWRLSSRGAGRVRPAQLAIIKQMSGQVSHGSAGDYQADDRAGVARLSWRLSSR